MFDCFINERQSYGIPLIVSLIKYNTVEAYKDPHMRVVCFIHLRGRVLWCEIYQFPYPSSMAPIHCCGQENDNGDDHLATVLQVDG